MPASAGAHERPEPRAVLWAALLSVFVFSVAAVMPLLTLPLLTLTPFPLAVLRLRGTLGNAVLATAMAAALVGALIGPGLGIMLAAVAAPGLALAPWDEVRSATFVEGLRAAGLPAEQIQWWLDRATLLHGVLEVVYPAFFLIMGAAIALGHALLLRLYLSRRDPGWLEGGEFENLRLPLVLSVAFVACGAAVLAPEARPLAYNVLLVLGFLYVLQGVAVVSFYARRLAAPPLLRAAVLVLVLVNPWAPQVLALLGLFDLWFDFRKWAEVEE